MNNLAADFSTIDMDLLDTVAGGDGPGFKARVNRVIDAGNRWATPGATGGAIVGGIVGGVTATPTGPGIIAGIGAGTAIGTVVGGAAGWLAGATGSVINQVRGH